MTAADRAESEPATTVAPEAAGWADSVRVRAAAIWIAYLVGSWALLRPVLLTTVYADDFVNPFMQFPIASLDPASLVEYAWNGTRGAGHINVVGQAIGAFNAAFNVLLMSVFGLRYSTIYAATKLVVYVVTALAASTFLRQVSAAMGRTVSPWRARIMVSVALFGTLQIHIPWSNDPVASYPLSGFATAAMGFGLLSLALRALQSDRLKHAVIAGVAGSLAVLYYEILVAAVVAIVPLAAWLWWSTNPRTRGSLQRVLALLLPMTLVPAAVAVLAKLTIGSTNSGYTGTAVSLGGGFVRSLWLGVVSTLPGAAWGLSREFLGGPVAIRASAVMILVVGATVLWSVAERHPWVRADGRVQSRIGFALLLASPLTFMLLAAAVQTGTQKVQDEAPKVGYVYNYYAIGATAWAVVIVLAILLAPRRCTLWPIRNVAVVLAAAFVSLQLMINWNITIRFNELTYPSRQLLVAFSEQLPEVERCSALQGWTLGSWPDYYEDSMVAGLQSAYEYFHDEQFCTGFVRPN
jgi:hypothetical protein